MKHLRPFEFKDETPNVEAAIASLTTAFDTKMTALDSTVKAVETKATDALKPLVERLDKIEAKQGRPGSAVETKDEAIALEAKALNSFFRGGAGALDDVEKKTLNLGTGSAGGYVTAPEYSKVIIEKLLQYSPLRSVASVMSIGSSKVYLPILNTRLSGGWVTETGSRPSSEPAFDQMSIEAFEQAVVVPISNQLLEDSFIDLQSYVSGQIATTFAALEADAFMTGDGSGKPTGLLKTPGDYAFVTANANGSDILTAVINAFYALPNAYASQGAWLMNRQTQGVIRAAADTANKTLWSDSLANGTPATLLGRPVLDAVSMDSLPTATGTKYPIAFGDYRSAYQIVDRVGIQIKLDDLTGADNGIVKIRARRRVGGAPTLTEAVVLVKSTKA
ncbi:MAG: phage major capsid protein [Xanthobacteraceae bacterium]|nr:phage major capsid protein [Xanthobacteraceae bacterium]